VEAGTDQKRTLKELKSLLRKSDRRDASRSGNGPMTDGRKRKTTPAFLSRRKRAREPNAPVISQQRRERDTCALELAMIRRICVGSSPNRGLKKRVQKSVRAGETERENSTLGKFRYRPFTRGSTDGQTSARRERTPRSDKLWVSE